MTPLATRLALPRLDAVSALAIAIAALVAVPVCAVAANLLQPGSGIMAHLARTVLPAYALNTALLAAGVAAGTFVIGVGAAWLVTMCRFPGRRALEFLLLLPLAAPAYVLAYSYTDLLQAAGPVQSWLREATGWATGDYWFPQVRSLPGAIAMLTLALYPYVYMLARASFLEQSVCVLEVSRSLGHGPWATFARVALPLARPSIAAGVALALMETLADYGTVAYFGVQTFTTGIYRAWFSHTDAAAAAQLSSLLLLFVAAVLLAERFSRGKSVFHHTSGRYRPLPAYRLTGARAAAAAAACALPPLTGFFIPAGSLALLAMRADRFGAGPGFAAQAGNSILLSLTTAGAALVLALAVAYAMRDRRNLVALAAGRVASLGYAIPGSVIAIGTLIPFAAFDNGLDAFMRSQFGVSTGLLLTGSIAGLVFACMVRFLGVAVQALDAGLSRITPAMDDAARVLGRGPLATLAQVHAPLMAPSALTALLLVFVDTMKELPATLLMRPFDFDTLAVRAYQLAADERLADAAAPALAIVLAGLLPIALLMRVISRGRPGDD